MIYLIIFVIFILAFIGSFFFSRSFIRKEIEQAELLSSQIKEKAQKEYKNKLIQAKDDAAKFILEEKEKFRQEQETTDEELHAYELQLEKESQKISSMQNEYMQRDNNINAGYAKLKQTYEEIKDLKRQKRELLSTELNEIEKIAKITAEELKNGISERIIAVAKKESKSVLMSYDDIPESDFIPQAKRIIGITIGRLQHTKIQEKYFSSVVLSQAQYENLIKVSGGNIKNFEEVINLPISISETEDGKINLKFDSIDAVNKEISRRIIDKLPKTIKNIDELIKFRDKKILEMKSELIGFGRKAFREVGLRIKESNEIIELLGRLYYRTSYTQNQWLHSVEAAKIAGLMAAELGMDVTLAKKAALLHDIGKALTHEKEGSHAVIGADEARKYNVDELVINAMESHHGDVPVSSMYSRLVMAADALSGGRPGARRELMETYFDRIQNLEKLVNGFDGVFEVQAVQAGRELRIVVDHKLIGDEDTEELAEQIAEKISDELVFPGQIKVTVIRNYKSVEYAR